MKRLLRWASDGAAAVSLLLLMAVSLLWVRSYWVGDRVYYHSLRDVEGPMTHRKQRDFKAGRGGIGFNQIVQDEFTSYRDQLIRQYLNPPGDTLLRHRGKARGQHA